MTPVYIGGISQKNYSDLLKWARQQWHECWYFVSASDTFVVQVFVGLVCFHNPLLHVFVITSKGILRKWNLGLVKVWILSFGVLFILKLKGRYGGTTGQQKIFTMNGCIINLSLWYCWWLKSCTRWYGKYPIVYGFLYIPGGAGFLPSTVVTLFKCKCQQQ